MTTGVDPRAPTRDAASGESHRDSRAPASAAIMARARAVFPGGVNSPVRAFGRVGGEPFVVARGEGARIWDVDGREYIDYVLSWGPLVLGHAPPVVLDALDRVDAGWYELRHPDRARGGAWPRPFVSDGRTWTCSASCRAARKRL